MFLFTFFLICSPVIIFSYFKKNNFYKTIVVFFACFYLFIASTHLNSRPFYKLINSYKLEKSYEDFADKVRCGDYDYYIGDRAGCLADKAIISHIESGKNIGIFPDGFTLMHIIKLAAIKKGANLDELIITRINSYDLKKYDYLIMANPGQIVTDFNRKDKKAFSLENPEKCIFKKSDTNKKITEIQCFIPYETLRKQGFEPVYNIKSGWSKTDNMGFYAQYIIWRKAI